MADPSIVGTWQVYDDIFQIKEDGRVESNTCDFTGTLEKVSDEEYKLNGWSGRLAGKEWHWKKDDFEFTWTKSDNAVTKYIVLRILVLEAIHIYT